MNKFFIVGITTLLFSGCSLLPSAWRSSRPAGQPAGETPITRITPIPSQTLEELDASVTSDLQTSMDADLKQIENDLNAVDQELRGY